MRERNSRRQAKQKDIVEGWELFITVKAVADTGVTKMKRSRLPSDLKKITSECVYSVSRGYFWSRDKDGGHTIRSVIADICSYLPH